jgi:hypothetical protein
VITCNLMGGLGNLLFQVTSAYSFAKDNGYNFCIKKNTPIDCVTQHYANVNVYSDNIFRNIKDGSITPKAIYKEPSFRYSPIKAEDDSILVGYYQSYKYFQHNREAVLELYKQDHDDLLKRYPIQEEQETIGIHVRRGDYLKYAHIHPPLQKAYYNLALENFSGKEKIVVFSDDIEFCKGIFDDAIYVEGLKDYEDMWLMSKCSHNIIANSTFSWWGAWLNSNANKKVIAPKIWFGPSSPHDISDLYPEEWITV